MLIITIALIGFQIVRNYNQIQISPSLQATYSNLNRIHEGEKNKVAKKYFSSEFKSVTIILAPEAPIG